MSVEGGSSAGAVGVGGIAALEATVPLARVELGRFSLDREGPVAPEALNTMAIVAKPISLVIQQAMDVAAAAWEAPQLNVPEVISEAESILAQARDRPVRPVLTETRPAVLTPIETIVHMYGISKAVVQNRPAPIAVPIDLVDVRPAIQTENTPLTQGVTRLEIAPQPQQTEEQKEAVEEKLIKENFQEKLEEEEIKEKRWPVEDEEVAAQRRQEIRQAVIKAKTEADRLGLKKIAGWLVAKFLPAEHAGNRSQVVKEKGPDGSYRETVEAIAGAGQLESEQQAQERFNEIVAAKKPVKYGKNGTPVGSEDVARVFKYHVVKPAASTYEIVTKRIKKKVPVPAGQVAQTQTEARVETSLEDYPDLAEVFKH